VACWGFVNLGGGGGGGEGLGCNGWLRLGVGKDTIDFRGKHYLSCLEG